MSRPDSVFNFQDIYNEKVLEVADEQLSGTETGLTRCESYYVILGFLYDNRSSEEFQKVIEKYDIEQAVVIYGSRAKLESNR